MTRAIILIKCISYIFIFLVFYGNIQEYGAPYYHGGSDDLDFEIYTMEFIKNNYIWPWEYKGIHNAKGMLSLFASLIRISNIFETYHTLAFRLLNMDILICISIILYKICRRDLRMSKKVSLICMLTMGLLPNSLFLTSFVFLNHYFFFIFFRFYKKGRFRNYIYEEKVCCTIYDAIYFLLWILDTKRIILFKYTNIYRVSYRK